MAWRRTVARALTFLTTLIGLAACVRSPTAWEPRVKDGAGLQAAIEQALRSTGQPSAACALVRSSGEPIAAAAGITRAGGGRPVSIESLYHIGSTTKHLTAALAAMLVKEGRLSYDTTLAEALPDIPMAAGYRGATIRDLLYSRAGIIPFQLTDREDPAVVEEMWNAIPARHPGDPMAQRRAVTRLALSLPPIQGGGKEPLPVYSNIGWVIFGHIIERVSGMSFEQALERKVLLPLGIEHYKLGGWPSDAYAPDQPVGHYPAEARGVVRRAQSDADNYRFPDWMNPAGGLNVDIHGYAAIAREQLLGLKGKGRLLDAAAYAEQHRAGIQVDPGPLYQKGPTDQRLGLGHGWAVVPTEAGDLSIAEGSGGTYFALLVVYPALDVAFAGLVNAGDGVKPLNAVIRIATGFDLELE